MYWWLYPSRLVLFLMVPIYIGCAGIDSMDYAMLYKQPRKFLTGYEFGIGITGLAAFIIGSWLAEPHTLPPRMPRIHFNYRILNRVLYPLFGIVLLAYTIFMLPLASNFHLVIELASGSRSAMFTLRDTLNSVPGLTSFVSLESLCLVLYLGYSKWTGYKPPRSMHLLMGTVVFACILRAWLWSERLAVLELLMPAVVVLLHEDSYNPNISVYRKRLFNLAPLYGVATAFTLFAVGEYFRSWQFYSAAWGGDFFRFAWVRFAGYYATALNNGALLINHLKVPYLPLNTANWFYRFPIWHTLGIDLDVNQINMSYKNRSIGNLLYDYGNVEFNNPGGIFMPYADFGPVLGTINWLVLGFISGGLLRSLTRMKLLGIVFFPIWYIGVLDILRLYYWGDSRFFPVILVSLIVIFFLGRHVKRRVPAPAPASVAPTATPLTHGS